MVGGAALDVKADRPLTPGTVLSLTVQQEGAAVKLMLALPPSLPARHLRPSRRARPSRPAQPPRCPTPLPHGCDGIRRGPSLPLPAQAHVAAAVVDLLARGLVPAATAQLGDGARVALAARPGSPGSLAAPAEGDAETSPAALRVAVTEGVRAAAGRQESLARSSPISARRAAAPMPSSCPSRSPMRWPRCWASVSRQKALRRRKGFRPRSPMPERSWRRGLPPCPREPPFLRTSRPRCFGCARHLPTGAPHCRRPPASRPGSRHTRSLR